MLNHLLETQCVPRGNDTNPIGHSSSEGVVSRPTSVALGIRVNIDGAVWDDYQEKEKRPA